MGKLTVTFPGGQELEFEIHQQRAKELYLLGLISRVKPGEYKFVELRIEEPLHRYAIALLDLQGDYL